MSVMRGCGRCAGVGSLEIRTPMALTAAIREVRRLVREGVLAESLRWPARTPRLFSRPLAELPEAGPWDDIVQNYLECPACGRLFLLHADVYHGAGGRFEPHIP